MPNTAEIDAEAEEVELHEIEEAGEGSSVPSVRAPRMPYYTKLEEEFGINKAAWRTLINAIWPEARTLEGVLMAIQYCKVRGLDVFKRPVHIVPIWNSKLGTYVETVWPGLNEVRTTAARTREYAGCDPCVFGLTVEEEFMGEIYVKKQKKAVRFKLKHPEWAQMTVYRFVQGQRVPFPGPLVYWKEIYATIGQSNIPNTMWQERPFGQIEKCAEVAALRRAYPEVGNEYIPEEVGRMTIDGEGHSIVSERGEIPKKPEIKDYAKRVEEAKSSSDQEQQQITLLDHLGETIAVITGKDGINQFADAFCERLGKMMDRADRNVIEAFIEHNQAVLDNIEKNDQAVFAEISRNIAAAYDYVEKSPAKKK